MTAPSREPPYWRYLPAPSGRRPTVKHALAAVDHVVAACGVAERMRHGWFGTGSQAEYDIAQSLPECRNCLRELRR